jgi:WD40 repeat protein
MLKRFLLLSVFFLLPSSLAWAQQPAIVSMPPEYVLDKQLPGEDPFSISRPTFDPAGLHVAAFMHSTRVLTVWDVKTGKVVAEIPETVHKMDGVDSLEFSTNGKNLLMVRKDLPLTYVDWAAGKVVKEVPVKAHPKKVYVTAYSPQQDLAAFGSDAGIAVWDLKAGKQVATYLKGVPVSGLDIVYYTDSKTKKPVRLLGFAKALVPPNTTFKDVAGVIDLGSGKITYLLNDVPADKKIEGKMTFTTFNFEYGGAHALITTMVFPPSVKAGAYLIDTWTGKWRDYLDLGEKTVAFRTQYLGKPYYGFVISSQDMSDPSSDYGVSTQFLVATRDTFKVVDTVDESKLAVQSIAINPKTAYAAITTKKNGSDPAKLWLYKLQPKKK